MGNRDREIFLDALEHLPGDLHRAKFDGASPLTPKPRRTAPKAVHDVVIDLHGLTRAEAIPRLRTVLAQARGKHRRILVITGRGNHSEDGIGVLQEAIVRFLENDGADSVRDYGCAAPEFGGAGALDIFVK